MRLKNNTIASTAKNKLFTISQIAMSGNLKLVNELGWFFEAGALKNHEFTIIADNLKHVTV